MKKELVIEDKKISYSVKRSKRSKSLKITAHHNGDIIVTMPFWLSESLAEEFLLKRSDWILKNLKYSEELKDKIILKNDLRTYKKHKEEARKLITKRVEHNNKMYNFSFNKIFIRNQKRQWGSCSENGNLNFNFKLLFLPEHLLDYVIIHEICHLKELNHSKRFWDLVEKTLPNHKELRRELKKYI